MSKFHELGPYTSQVMMTFHKKTSAYSKFVDPMTFDLNHVTWKLKQDDQ